MEPRKQKLHNFVPTVETPVLLSSSIPTNCVQFPSSAWFPLSSSSALGNVLSVPIVGHQLVSPVQQKQQLLMQREPLILLPTSTLSFSPHSNIVVSAPSLSPQIQSSSVLHSQQLHQVPLLLKQSDSPVQVDPAFNVHQMSQQFIVLPVGGVNENPAPILDKVLHSRSIPEHSIILGNESNLGNNKNNLMSKQGIIHHLNVGKPESTKTKMKIRHKNTQATTVTKPDSSTDSSVLETSKCELNKLDITQIISSIPSGWKVVGVTGLDQLIVGDLMSSSKPSSSLPLSDIKSKSSSREAHIEEGKNKVSLLAEEVSSHDQPSLVSVNLNTASQPVASETVFDKWPTNELTCSVKMDDIPCTHVISIKTECIESNDDKFEDAVERLECEHFSTDQEEPTQINERHTNPCSTNVDTNMQSQESGKKADPESYGSSENNFISQESAKIQSPGPDFACTQTVPTDSKWTIVGITSLSPLSTTCTITTSQAGMASLEKDCDVTVDRSSSNATILNIPVCSSAVSHANEDKNTNVYNKKVLHKLRENLPASLILNDTYKSNIEIDYSTKTKPEDMKWTIVGLMGSPLTNSSVLNPNISPESEFFRNSYPITSSPLSSNRLETVVNNQLLNILSPLSSTATSPILLPSEQISPNTQGTRQSKQEAVKKLPQTRFSSNNDYPKQETCSQQSQNQWKIVGVTQFGIPPTTTSSIVSVSQLNPISPSMSVPLLIPASSGPLLSHLTAQATCMVTQATSAIPSTNLLSSSTLPSLFSQPALPFPVFNLNGTSYNSTMTLSTPASLLDTVSPASIHTMQDLSQQQNLNQLIQSQLTACQNPISMLTVNDPNQWNVIGVVANNQVSLLNQNQGNPPAVTTMTPEPKLSSQDVISHISVTSTQNIKSKQNTSNSDANRGIRGAAANKSVTIRQSLSSKREDSDSKRHFKSRVTVNKRQQESTKIKKNTVSNLLRMKRMQQGTCENGSSEDGDQSFEEYQDFTDTSYEVPQKKTKIRSLRSYAGNRKIFTRRQNKLVDEKINLRSGTQIQIMPSKSDDDNNDDDDDAEMLPINSKKMDDKVTEVVMPVKETQNDVKYTEVKLDVHSSSRRRKLKVPRKLIADLDYHPFDSSSDSN